MRNDFKSGDSTDSGSENDPQASAPGTPIIPINAGDYPELDGMEPGATVTGNFTAEVVETEAEKEGEKGGKGLQIMHLELEGKDNEADKELKRMAGEPDPSLGAPPGATDAGSKGF